MTAREARDFMEWARQLNFALELIADELKEIRQAKEYIISLDKKYISCPEVAKLKQLYKLDKELHRKEKQTQQTIAAYIDGLKDDRKKDYLIAYVLQYKTDAEIKEKYFYSDAATVFKLKGKACERFMKLEADRAEKIKNISAEIKEKIKLFLNDID